MPRLLITLVCLMALQVGCGVTRRIAPAIPAPTVVAEHVAPVESPQVRSLRDQKAEAEAKAREWFAKAQAVDNQIKEERTAEKQDRVQTWAMIFFGVAGACLVAALFLPLGLKRWGMIGAAGFGTLGACALGVAEFLPYAKWAALVLLAGGGVAMAWIFGGHHKKLVKRLRF